MLGRRPPGTTPLGATQLAAGGGSTVSGVGSAAGVGAATATGARLTPNTFDPGAVGANIALTNGNLTVTVTTSFGSASNCYARSYQSVTLPTTNDQIVTFTCTNTTANTAYRVGLCEAGWAGTLAAADTISLVSLAPSGDLNYKGQFGNVHATLTALSNGDVVRFRISGTDLYVKINSGTETGPYTLAYNTSPLYVAAFADMTAASMTADFSQWNAAPATSGVGSAAGVGAASATGAALALSPAAATGVGAATSTGASLFAAAASVAGVGVALGTAAALFSAVGSSAGVGAASATSTATAAGVGSTAGVGAAASTGAALSATVGTTAGIGAASATGSSSTAGGGVASAAGVGAASATGASRFATAGSIAGVGSATAATAYKLNIVGAASGTGAASAVGRGVSVINAVASASGVGAAAGASAFSSSWRGSASGAAAVTGGGASSYEYFPPHYFPWSSTTPGRRGWTRSSPTGAWTDTATPGTWGAPVYIFHAAVATAAGSSSMLAFGLSPPNTARTGSAAGTSTVAAVGKSMSARAATAAGVGTATGRTSFSLGSSIPLLVAPPVASGSPSEGATLSTAPATWSETPVSSAVTATAAGSSTAAGVAPASAAWSSTDTASNTTLSTDKLTMSSTGDGAWVRATVGRNSGKRTVKFTAGSSDHDTMIGVTTATADLGDTAPDAGYSPLGWHTYIETGAKVFNGTTTVGSMGLDLHAGDLVAFICDFDNDKLWITVNGVSISGDPVAGTGGYTAGWGGATIYPAAKVWTYGYGTRSVTADFSNW